MSTTDFESIHNYYERLVLEGVLRTARERRGTVEPKLVADIACVALNHLPPRYIRHDVDLSFYLTEKEREHNARIVKDAVDNAFAYVLRRRRKRAD
jgi:hypothetical protein